MESGKKLSKRWGLRGAGKGGVKGHLTCKLGSFHFGGLSGVVFISEDSM